MILKMDSAPWNHLQFYRQGRGTWLRYTPACENRNGPKTSQSVLNAGCTIRFIGF